MVYTTFEYYTTNYGNITDETEFAKLNKRASAVIDAVTGNRASSAIGFKAARLQDCCCSLVDLLASEQNIGVGSGLTSFSNDGYSETYTLVTADDVETSHKQFVTNFLSGTGLVSAL